MPLYTIDLFAGAGGLTEGFRQAQFQTALANDIDENAKQTFTYNHPTVPFITGNIQSFSPNDYHDVNKTIHAIIGGPPCQGFSVAGKRLSNDPRNQLFKEYIRIVHSVKPQVIMFENVPGIITIQNGQIVSAILSELKSIGYNCDYQIINSAQYGVPQTRKRFILLGRLDNKPISFPNPTNVTVSFWDAVSDLPSIAPGEGSEEILHYDNYSSPYQYDRKGQGTLFNHRATNHNPTVSYRYSLIQEGQNISSIPIHLQTKKRDAFKLNKNLPSRTVTCNFRTDLIHPIMNRGLTTREAARLQSFNDDYKFFGPISVKSKYLTQDEQVGNAVPPILANIFANHIKNNFL